MKLVVTIVQDKDSNRLSNAFIESDIRATKLSSTGGFLRSGNTTFLIGIEDERVEEVLGIIKEVSKTLRIRDAVGKRRQSDRSNEHVSD